MGFFTASRASMRRGALRPQLKSRLSIFVLCALSCFSSSHFALTVQKPSSEAQLHAEKGIEASRAGDLSTAEHELREAVQLAPDDPFFLATLGSILGMQWWRRISRTIRRLQDG